MFNLSIQNLFTYSYKKKKKNTSLYVFVDKHLILIKHPHAFHYHESDNNRTMVPIYTVLKIDMQHILIELQFVRRFFPGKVKKKCVVMFCQIALTKKVINFFYLFQKINKNLIEYFEIHYNLM